MKPILIVLVSAYLLSCSQKIYPVIGKYPEPPIEIKSSKTFDQVWDNVIDMFAQKGLSIRIIDRSSGLIISDKSALSVTIEDNKGIPLDPNAFIVVPKYKDKNTYKMVPVTGRWYNTITKKMENNSAFGDWNIRVKKTDGGCLINVNITNMNYSKQVIINSKKIDQLIALSSGKTTGVFENYIANYIK